MPLGIVSLLPMILIAIAGPALVAWAPRGEGRRLAFGGVVGMFLTHAGLFLLFYSRLLCWILVGLALVVMILAAFPRRRAFAGGAALVALTLGIAFQLTPGDPGILLYVGAATPTLLGVGLAVLASGALRHDASRLSYLGAALTALFAGIIPLTSFWPSFLLTFEPMHLGFAGLGLAGLALLARVQPARVETWGEIAARPEISHRAQRALIVAGALAAAAAAFARPGPVTLLAGGALVALALVPTRLLLVALAALPLAGIVAGEAALDLHLRGASALPLALASIGASTLVATLALALACWRDWSAREWALAKPRPHPADAIVMDGVPTPDAVRALTALVPSGRIGILRVRAPPDDPFWTLPEDCYRALLATGMHAEIVEGEESSLVPPIAEGERA